MEIRTQDFIAGVLMITLGVIGFLANALIFFVLHKSFRASTFSAFSVLCCSRSLSNCGTLLCFVLYSGPVTLLGYPYGPPILGLKFGHFTTLTYKSVVYVQLAIAFNRFIATFFTFKYPNICHRKGTFILLGCVWFITGLHCVPEFLPGCGYTYFYNNLAWNFINTSCSELLGGPILYYPSYTVFLGSIVLNGVLFIKLSYHTLIHSKEMGGQSRERHRKNVRCFVQSFLQELLYIFEMAFLQIMKPTDRFMEFVCYSLLWECTHVWDGWENDDNDVIKPISPLRLIVIIYRPDMRERLPLCWSSGRKKSMAIQISVAQSTAKSSRVPIMEH